MNDTASTVDDRSMRSSDSTVSADRRAKRRQNRMWRTVIGGPLGAVGLMAAGITIPALAADAPAGCTTSGHLTYNLARAAAPTPEQTDAYNKITVAMDEALAYYNCYADFTKTINVSFDPAVPTAQGAYNGDLRFGATSTMQRATAMHELAHTVGVGTSPRWAGLTPGGVYTGAGATQKVKDLTAGATTTLNADASHFWPYGLNQPSEVTSDDVLRFHVQIVDAMVKVDGL